MSERLYGGKTLDELKCHAVGAKQWRGKSFDIRIGLIDRIYELEKALEFYAEEINWHGWMESIDGYDREIIPAILDGGAIARKARGER